MATVGNNSYERKRNRGCVANLHCECQLTMLKPKVETNKSFLVLHPFSGVDTVNTVGSQLYHTFYLENCQSNTLVTTYQYRGLPGSPSGLRKVFSSPVKRSLIKDNDQGLAKGTKRKIRVKNGNRLTLNSFTCCILT